MNREQLESFATLFEVDPIHSETDEALRKRICRKITGDDAGLVELVSLHNGRKPKISDEKTTLLLTLLICAICALGILLGQLITWWM